MIFASRRDEDDPSLLLESSSDFLSFSSIAYDSPHCPKRTLSNARLLSRSFFFLSSSLYVTSTLGHAIT